MVVIVVTIVFMVNSSFLLCRHYYGLSGPCSHRGFMAVILVILVILAIADNGVIVVMVILVIEILALIVVIRDLQIRGRGRDKVFRVFLKSIHPAKFHFTFFTPEKLTLIFIEMG